MGSYSENTLIETLITGLINDSKGGKALLHKYEYASSNSHKPCRKPWIASWTYNPYAVRNGDREIA